MSEQDLLTTTQAANEIGVGRGAIARAVASGSLPAVRAGRFHLIRPADLARWFEAGNYHPNMAVWKGKTRKRRPGRPKKRGKW